MNFKGLVEKYKRIICWELSKILMSEILGFIMVVLVLFVVLFGFILLLRNLGLYLDMLKVGEFLVLFLIMIWLGFVIFGFGLFLFFFIFVIRFLFSYGNEYF